MDLKNRGGDAWPCVWDHALELWKKLQRFAYIAREGNFLSVALVDALLDTRGIGMEHH